MIRVDPGRAFLLGWRIMARLPEPVVSAVLLVAADLAWLRGGGGVRRLRANIARVRPEAGRRELSRLTREGMRNYLRYFGEMFRIDRWTAEQIDARVRAVGADVPLAEVSAGRAVVLVLGHQGNWDLAGAWASRHLAPAIAVAERLEPPELFDEFVRMRAAIGIDIIPLDRGSDVFRRLVGIVRAGNALVPLLADRDLTSSGVEVDLCGHRARVAAGPAAIAVSTGTMVVPTTLRHERLRGRRLREARSRWGLVVTFHPPVEVPEDGSNAQKVATVTQAWVDVLGADIAEFPTHWHMLQKVFVADLDPARYTAVTGQEES